MSAYDNLPYELQSPTWRNAFNYSDTGANTWNPTLNDNKTADILNASLAVARANGVNTAQVDGSSGFLSNLSGFGQALLQSIGVQPEQPAQAQQVAWRQSRGIDQQTLIVMGLLAFGAYVAFGAK